MTELATQVPTSIVISMLSAINDENHPEFKKLELDFVEKYDIETWEDVFNFRVMPALSQASKQWLLIQKCSKGYTVKELV